MTDTDTAVASTTEEIHSLRRELAAYKMAALRVGEGIAEISRLNQEVESQKRQLAAVIENTEDLICSLDRGLCLTLYNGAFEALWRKAAPSSPLCLGETILAIVSDDAHGRVESAFRAGLLGERCSLDVTFRLPDGVVLTYELAINPIITHGDVVGVALLGRDIGPRKEAEAKLKEAHARVVELSRLAGMSEVASDILHNVGNVLTSVNVSVSQLKSAVARIPTREMGQLSELLEQNASDLGRFFTQDPRAKVVPTFLREIVSLGRQVQGDLQTEVQSLQTDVEHVARIISTQQQFAKSLGVEELLQPKEILVAALRLVEPTLKKFAVEISEELDDVPACNIDRHRLLQVIVNLLSNARHALRDSKNPKKTLRIRLLKRPKSFVIEVEDNGIGIKPEIMSRLFEHGFTTKVDGHGFGLHSSALAVQMLRGTIQPFSDGPGQGARFVVELPLEKS